MKKFGILASLVGCLALTACTITVDPSISKADEQRTLTAAFDGIGTFVIDWQNGDVTVRFDAAATEVSSVIDVEAWGSDSAEAQSRLTQITTTLEVDPNDPTRLILRLVGPTNHSFSYGGDVVVTLPGAVAIDADNDAGGVDVQGNAATTTIDIVAGDATVADNTGDVNVTVETGEALIARVTGKTVVEVEVGEISITAQQGDCEVEMSVGEVGVQSNGGNVMVEGENGEINIEANPAAGGSVTADLDNGTIDIAVPTTFAAALELDATFGVVRDDLDGFTVEGLVREGSVLTRRVTATLNGGGGTITAETTTGTIRFEGL